MGYLIYSKKRAIYLEKKRLFNRIINGKIIHSIYFVERYSSIIITSYAYKKK